MESKEDSVAIGRLSDRPRKSRRASMGGQQWGVRIGAWIEKTFGDIRPA